MNKQILNQSYVLTFTGHYNPGQGARVKNVIRDYWQNSGKLGRVKAELKRGKLEISGDIDKNTLVRIVTNATHPKVSCRIE